MKARRCAPFDLLPLIPFLRRPEVSWEKGQLGSNQKPEKSRTGVRKVHGSQANATPQEIVMKQFVPAFFRPEITLSQKPSTERCSRLPPRKEHTIYQAFKQKKTSSPSVRSNYPLKAPSRRPRMVSRQLLLLLRQKRAMNRPGTPIRCIR